MPDSQDFGYDSYAGLDVKDKIVLVLRYFPEDAEPKTKAILARYSDLRYKAMAGPSARREGDDRRHRPASPNAGELVPMTFDTALAGSGIVAISVTGEMAKALFARAEDKTLEDAQKALDSGNPHVAGFDLPGVTAQSRQRSSARSRPATTSSPTCRPRRRRRASRNRGSRSGRTTIISATATAAIRSRARKRRDGSTWAPTTTRRARRRCWRSAKRCPNNRAGATCCSISGRAKSSACSARRPLPPSRRCRSIRLPRI